MTPGRIPKTCGVCGVGFTVARRVAEGPRFCSRSCYAIHQAGKPRAKVDPVIRFLALANKSEGCWEWKGSRLPKGYGTFKMNRKNIYAHRASLLLLKGIEVPADLCAMHSCDNPPCVNPDHLSVGTRSDNMQDASRKGRMPGNRRPRK